MATKIKMIGLSAHMAIAFLVTFFGVNLAIAQVSTKTVDRGEAAAKDVVAVTATEVAPRAVTASVEAMQAPVYRWYELIQTSSADTSVQVLASGTPLSPAEEPDEDNPSECAKQNNFGNYCAVLIAFPPGTSGPSLTLPSGTVGFAIANSTAIDVATGVTAQDPDGDGYSRLP